MNTVWSTKQKDMKIAKQLMESYAEEADVDILTLVELIVDIEEKAMDFRLSSWVVRLAKRFIDMYGEHHGEFVTRKIITYCILQNDTVH